MTTPIIIRPGGSLPFTFDLNGDSISGWTCTIELKKYPSDAAIVNRVITTTDGNQWIGTLTSVETATLTSGSQYTLLAHLENTTTDESEEVPKKFYVGVNWAT